MMGGPKKKPAERRENVLRIRLTEAERAALEKAAGKELLDASTWARRVLLLEARRIVGDDRVRGTSTSSVERDKGTAKPQAFVLSDPTC